MYLACDALYFTPVTKLKAIYNGTVNHDDIAFQVTSIELMLKTNVKNNVKNHSKRRGICI